MHADDRGSFQQTYRRSWFPLGREMVQGSRSEKVAGRLVGLHYHLHQADNWRVVNGAAFVVLYDLRKDSDTHDAVMAFEMGETTPVGVSIPPGVAHGFAIVTDITLTYLVDSYYNPSDELGIAWNDPKVAGIWPLADPVVSAREMANPKLPEFSEQLVPYGTARAAG